MKITETEIIPATPEQVSPFVDDLAEYPRWLGLVNSVEETKSSDDGEPAWNVELRAKIGPFARSKQLRMVRTAYDYPNGATFERSETDGKDHAMWALRAELAPTSDGTTKLTMHLAYDGDLWAGGGLIGTALNQEIKKGRARLAKLVAEASENDR